MRDSFGREINYLRLSVTSRCNFRCRYCAPQGTTLVSHDDILRIEELERLARAAAAVGLTKFRITGGEPLLRKGIENLVSSLASIPGVRSVGMTTNGSLLVEKVAGLAAAGLTRVNVSLDTLHADKFRWVTGGGDLARVLDGLREATSAGLRPIRVNCVLVRGFNDDEVEELARLTLDHDWDVRFIELMPLWASRAGIDAADAFMPISVAVDKARSLSAEPEPRGGHEWEGGRGRDAGGPPAPDDGPATYWKLPSSRGRVGFISSGSGGTCPSCNRMRLTARGVLMGCLYSPDGTDLKNLVRSGCSDDRLVEAIAGAVLLKPRSMHEGLGGEGLRGRLAVAGRVLSDIGG